MSTVRRLPEALRACDTGLCARDKLQAGCPEVAQSLATLATILRVTPRRLAEAENAIGRCIRIWESVSDPARCDRGAGLLGGGGGGDGMDGGGFSAPGASYASRNSHDGFLSGKMRTRAAASPGQPSARRLSDPFAPAAARALGRDGDGMGLLDAGGGCNAGGAAVLPHTLAQLTAAHHIRAQVNHPLMTQTRQITRAKLSVLRPDLVPDTKQQSVP